MFAPPTHAADPAFECVGGTFWVRKNDADVGLRARVRLLELSALDWTVTNYAKRRSVTLLCRDAGGAPSRWFSVHTEYKAWLRVWRRKLFDPFARRSRVFFEGGEDAAWVATTAAQLNFLFFAVEFGILEWVRRHLAEVERDNNRALRRTGGQEDRKRKRTALSAPPPVSVMIVDRPITVTWE